MSDNERRFVLAFVVFSGLVILSLFSCMVPKMWKCFLAVASIKQVSLSFMMQNGEQFLKTSRHDNEFGDTNQQVHWLFIAQAKT